MANTVLDEIAKEHRLQLWATMNGEKGKSYQYMEMTYGINVIFNEWDESYEIKWLIPKSIFTIECPSCSPYTNREHFDRMYVKFWKTIFRFNENMPSKYTRESIIL